jgi:hypothetical protein
VVGAQAERDATRTQRWRHGRRSASASDTAASLQLDRGQQAAGRVAGVAEGWQAAIERAATNLWAVQTTTADPTASKGGGTPLRVAPATRPPSRRPLKTGTQNPAKIQTSSQPHTHPGFMSPGLSELSSEALAAAAAAYGEGTPMPASRPCGSAAPRPPSPR